MEYLIIINLVLIPVNSYVAGSTKDDTVRWINIFATVINVVVVANSVIRAL